MMNNYSKETTELKFEADCTIYEISVIHKNLSEAFKKSPIIKLDFSGIENIDASFIQLLIATQLEAKRNEAKLEFTGDLGLVNELAKNINCELSSTGIDNFNAGGE